MQEEIDERALIEGCLNEDRESQEQLYRLFADKMFSVCLYYAEDRDEACDFLQDGYLTVFRKLDQYNFSGSLEGWIRRIIVNTALSHLRRKKKFNAIIEEVKYEEEYEQMDEVEMEQIPVKKIISMVNSLPGKCALVLKLYALEGYTHVEIAEIMDITVGTSKSQLNRARTLLKKEIKSKGILG